MKKIEDMTCEEIEAKIEEIHAAMDCLVVDQDICQRCLYQKRMQKHTPDLKLMVDNLLQLIEELHKATDTDKALKTIAIVAKSIQSGMELFQYVVEEEEDGDIEDEDETESGDSEAETEIPNQMSLFEE